MRRAPRSDTHDAWRRQIQSAARKLLDTRGLAAAADTAGRRAALDRYRALWRQSLAPLDTLLPHTPPTGRMLGEEAGDGFRLQNIVLDSVPGWHVGLNLFLPEGEGPFVPVLCPCGHGPKWQADHQIPPQVLARNGFAAALCDAPGLGEKAARNDHFVQGAQAMAAGLWSQLFFLMDPIRVADYLATRPDITFRAGLGVTGVSGGGCTTLSLVQADPRVRAIAPVCCLSTAREIVIESLYTNCPEDYVPGQFAIGMDADDLLSMAAPIPCLVMGGSEDRFFSPETAHAALAKARLCYEDEGAGEVLDLFIDDTGHAYTERMALKAADWFRRRLGGGAPGERSGVTLLDRRQLDCGTTGQGDGMLDVIRQECARLRSARAPVADLRALLPILKPDVTRRRQAAWELKAETSPTAEPAVMRGSVRARGTVPLPAVEHRRPSGEYALLAIFTDGDKHAALREVYSVRHFRRVAAIDLRGVGELTPRPSSHDVKPWCAIDRALSDLSLMTGHTPAGMQAADALRALDAAMAGENAGDRIAVLGRGEAALPALFAALIHPRANRLILDAFPASLEHLAASEHLLWLRYACVPGILRHFDVPELLAAAGGRRVLLINPLDAAKRRLDEVAARRLYAGAPAVSIHVDTGEAQPVEALREWLDAHVEKGAISGIPNRVF